MSDLNHLKQTLERLLYLPEPEEAKKIFQKATEILGVHNQPIDALDNKTLISWYQNLEKAPYHHSRMSDQEKESHRQTIQECLEVIEFQASYMVLSQFLSPSQIPSSPHKRKELFYACTSALSQFPFLTAREKTLHSLAKNGIIPSADYGLDS